MLLMKIYDSVHQRRNKISTNAKLMGAFGLQLWRAQDFSSYFYKMATMFNFGFLIFAKIDKLRTLYVINGLIWALVSETVAVAGPKTLILPNF